jgi:hypothetical protein
VTAQVQICPVLAMVPCWRNGPPEAVPFDLRKARRFPGRPVHPFVRLLLGSMHPPGLSLDPRRDWLPRVNQEAKKENGSISGPTSQEWLWACG